MSVCARFSPVQVPDGSEPADIASAARQNGQVMRVQRQEEALCGELWLRELGGVLICERHIRQAKLSQQVQQEEHIL